MDIDGNLLLQLGVGGIFAIMLIREAAALIEKVQARMKGDDGKLDCDTCLDAIHDKTSTTLDLVKDLHEWHNIRDHQTGIPVWYSGYATTELKNLLVAMSENTRAQTDVLRQVLELSRESSAEIRATKNEVGVIKTAIQGLSGGGRGAG